MTKQIRHYIVADLCNILFKAKDHGCYFPLLPVRPNYTDLIEKYMGSRSCPAYDAGCITRPPVTAFNTGFNITGYSPTFSSDLITYHFKRRFEVRIFKTGDQTTDGFEFCGRN